MKKIAVIILYSVSCWFIGYSLLLDPKLYLLNREGDLLTLALAGLLFLACLYGAIWNALRLARGGYD